MQSAVASSKQTKQGGKSPRPVPEIPEKLMKAPAVREQAAPIQVKASGGAADGKDAGAKEGTQGVPALLKAKFEGALGVDLSAVTLHTGATADEACKKRGAVAFCQGNEIYLSADAGPIGSPEAARVIAHELIHVIQQMVPDKAEKAEQEAGGEEAATEGPAKDKKAKGEGKEGALSKEAAQKGKSPAGAKGQDSGKADAKGGGASPNLESEAHAAGDKALAGQPVEVKGQAPKGMAQNLDKGASQAPKAADPKAAPKDAESINSFFIPIPLTGQTIKVAIPPRHAANKNDFSVGLDSIKDIGKPLSVGSKPWRKSINIPTPCAGLNLELGIEAGAKVELKPFSWKELTLSRKGGEYKVETKLSTSLEMSANVALLAGVNAGCWIASAGAGLKARAAASTLREITLPLSATLSPGQRMPSFSAGIEFAPFDIEAKFQGAAYVYVDTFFTSTYEKEWQFYERSLGKISFAKIKGGLDKSGFSGGVDGPQLQNFQGAVSDLYPKR